MVTQKKSSKSKSTVVRPKKTIQKTAKAKAKSPKKTQEELNKDKRYYEAVGRRNGRPLECVFLLAGLLRTKKLRLKLTRKLILTFFLS